jgi:hypothetical protein
VHVALSGKFIANKKRGRGRRISLLWNQLLIVRDDRPETSSMRSIGRMLFPVLIVFFLNTLLLFAGELRQPGTVAEKQPPITKQLPSMLADPAIDDGCVQPYRRRNALASRHLNTTRLLKKTSFSTVHPIPCDVRAAVSFRQFPLNIHQVHCTIDSTVLLI